MMETKANSIKVLNRLRISAIASTVLFIAAVFIFLFIGRGRLDIYLPQVSLASELYTENDTITIGWGEGHVIVSSQADSGDSFIFEKTSDGISSVAFIKVLPFGLLTNMNNFNFSGCRPIAFAFLLYLVILTAGCIASSVIRFRHDLFSYTTLFYAGMSLFLIVILIVMTGHILEIFIRPDDFSMLNVFSSIRYAGEDFLVRTMLFIMVFALALAVSNITLIRREGRRFVNLLGIILSAMLIFGYVGYSILSYQFNAGSVHQMKMYGAFLSIFSTSFAYFECMLVSASVCGLIAARHKPKYDKTHVIILGCAISDDGTPLPLLRGRIDRAIAFAKEQKEKTGKDIVFVPSGGQGSDEVISEAESMGNYLVSQGISAENIILENKSVNTMQNMQFSLERIKESCGEPNIIFSTSEYHVLRSGMISRTAGLEAEGIGSKTKWYFWPNAFVREFVGLLASKWKRHACLIAFFIALFIILNILLPM